MPLRIGFDLDGVLADMESELFRQADALFGAASTRRLRETSASAAAGTGSGTGDEASDDADPSSYSAPEASADLSQPLLRANLTARQQRKLWRHIATVENFWGTLAEIEPGVIKRLAAMAMDRRWEIIFLTRRPETAGPTSQVQTQRWLQSKGFPLPSVYVVQGSRGLIAAALALDVVIDDRPENCLDVVADSKARAILVWRDDESKLPPGARRLGIGVVKSVAACLHVLTELDTARGNHPGMMDRVRRMLGLKSPAPAV